MRPRGSGHGPGCRGRRRAPRSRRAATAGDLGAWLGPDLGEEGRRGRRRRGDGFGEGRRGQDRGRRRGAGGQRRGRDCGRRDWRRTPDGTSSKILAGMFTGPISLLFSVHAHETWFSFFFYFSSRYFYYYNSCY